MPADASRSRNRTAPTRSAPSFSPLFALPSSAASLGLTALVLGVGTGILGGTRVACAQRSLAVTKGYYTASSGIAFTVPVGVASIQIEAWGGGGAGGQGYDGGIGGAGGGGGFAGGTFDVTPNQVLTLLIGGGGTDGLRGTGGVNGGGTSYVSGSGGGYSAIYKGTNLTTANLLLVAGGGGGGGYSTSIGGAGSAGGSGIAGGNSSSSSITGVTTGGGAGTETDAGAGGTGTYADGNAGSGMSGGGDTSNSGGGGGGGYFGGGQGGQSRDDSTVATASGGGGGGSSFILASASNATLTGGNGARPGNDGSSRTYPDYRSGVGVGTAGTSSRNDAATGGSGEVFLRYATFTTFDYTGNGSAGSTSAPVTGNFSTGFAATLTVGNGVAPLTFGGTSYTATDDLTNSVAATGLTFTNTGAVTLARGTNSDASNLIALYANSSTNVAPTIALSTGAVTVGLDLELDATTTTISGTGPVLLSGDLSGRGGLTKTNGGTLTLTGANTYTGGTTISTGTVAVGGNSALGSGAVAMASGTTLTAVAASSLPNAVTLSSVANLSSGTVTTANVHVPGLALNGPVTLNSPTYSTNLNITGSSRVAITGAVGEKSGQPTVLVKSGAGTLELDHDNTYSGGTLVAAGTLVVNNNYVAGGYASGANGSGTGQGAVTVAKGATLTGAYVISGPVQVNAGGTIAVGNSIGVGSVGALNLAGGSVLDFELGTDGMTSDRIDVTSLLSRSGTGGIDFDLTGEHLSNGTLNPISAGNFTLLTFGASSGLTAADFRATGLPTGWTSTFSLTSASGSGPTYRPGSFSVVVGAAAPEPGALWLLLPGIPGALVGFAVGRRRKSVSLTVLLSESE